MDNPPPRRISNAVLAAIGGLVLAIGGGTTWVVLNSRTPAPTIPTNSPTPTNPSSPNPTSADNQQPRTVQQQTAKIYWLQDQGNKFELVDRPVTLDKSASKNPNDILKQAFKRLLAGPSSTEKGVSTTIPQETKLRSVTVQNDTVNVDLSQEFTSGGGSASMTGRLGQVIYTATSLNPNAKVFLSIEGKRLETLGGEGLELEQPLTRESFQKDFPL